MSFREWCGDLENQITLCKIDSINQKGKIDGYIIKWFIKKHPHFMLAVAQFFESVNCDIQLNNYQTC